MSKQREWGGALDLLMDLHKELMTVSRDIRGANGESALARVISLVERHEAARLIVLEAARNALLLADVSKLDERWQTVRTLTADLRGRVDSSPFEVDEVVGMLYDHAVDANVVIAKPHLLLDDAGYPKLLADLADAMGTGGGATSDSAGGAAKAGGFGQEDAGGD